MPLSEQLRLNAGRSFTTTLMVRVYVALVLLAVVAAVTNKHKIDYSKYDLLFGKSEIIKMDSLPTHKIDSLNIKLSTSNVQMLVAKNDTNDR